MQMLGHCWIIWATMTMINNFNIKFNIIPIWISNSTNLHKCKRKSQLRKFLSQLSLLEWVLHHPDNIPHNVVVSCSWHDNPVWTGRAVCAWWRQNKMGFMVTNCIVHTWGTSRHHGTVVLGSVLGRHGESLESISGQGWPTSSGKGP